MPSRQGCPKGRVVGFFEELIKSGYYDIVIEDNGPGVKSEKSDKLLLPTSLQEQRTGLGPQFTQRPEPNAMQKSRMRSLCAWWCFISIITQRATLQ